MIGKLASVGGVLFLAMAAAEAEAADGRTVFAENCAACDRVNGAGVPGAFAGDLDDDEMASVLTYIRGAWGNKAKAVQVADVASVRGKARREDARASLQAH